MSNNTNTKAMSFWKFMNDNIIEIPIIQRDYAHGRLGKENLRKNFLADLKKALDNESPYKDTSMKLDFIYVSIENGKLNLWTVSNDLPPFGCCIGISPYVQSS